MEKAPFAGFNIVVTRPHNQAIWLTQQITEQGGNSILFPLLEISPVADPYPLTSLVARLAEFDLAIFISPNAVRYGMAAILDAGTVPTLLKIATVGQGSANALRTYGISNIIAPQEHFDSESLLALPELQHIQGWRIVIFRGDAGRELLGDSLIARGAVVEYAACYKRTKPQQFAGDLWSANPNIMTITSSEALRYLWDMFTVQDRQQLINLPLFVPHERIAQAAITLGWKEVITTAGGETGLMQGLASWISTRQAP